MASDDTGATGKYLDEFLAFMQARQAAEADDNDPDNGRDITLQKGDQVLTIPYRLAKQFDLDGFLAGTFGIKRKAAPAGKAGDSGAGSGGKESAQGGSAATNVRDFFKGAGKQPPAATGS